MDRRDRVNFLGWVKIIKLGLGSIRLVSFQVIFYNQKIFVIFLPV